MRTSPLSRSTLRFLLVSAALVACGGCSAKSDDAPPTTDDTGGAETSGDATGDGASDGAGDARGDADAPIDVGVDTFDATPACTPPTFGGLTKIDAVDEKSAHLHWDAATDAKTPASAITYLVYLAPSGTSIDFTKSSASVVGKTDLVVGGLTKETTYFFVVRASNGGCQDSNFLVRTATTAASCNFAQVQPIFDRNCAVAGCHVLPSPPQGMTLSSGFSFSNTVNVTSAEDPTLKRIKPFDSENSYLYRKITGRPAAGTNGMPPPGATSLPTAEEKDLIKCWIDHGALP